LTFSREFPEIVFKYTEKQNKRKEREMEKKRRAKALKNLD